MWYYTAYFFVVGFLSLVLGLAWNKEDLINLFLKGLFLFIFVWSVFLALLNSGFVVHN